MKSDKQVNYEEFIHDRGRGPEIKGTRITVYAILDYLLLAWLDAIEKTADVTKCTPSSIICCWLGTPISSRLSSSLALSRFARRSITSMPIHSKSCANT